MDSIDAPYRMSEFDEILKSGSRTTDFPFSHEHREYEELGDWYRSLV